MVEQFTVHLPDPEESARILDLVRNEFFNQSPGPKIDFLNVRMPGSAQITVQKSEDTGEATTYQGDFFMPVPVTFYPAEKKVVCVIYAEPIVIKGPPDLAIKVERRNKQIDFRAPPMLQAWIEQYVIYPDLPEYTPAFFESRLDCGQSNIRNKMKQYRTMHGTSYFDKLAGRWCFTEKHKAIKFENWMKFQARRKKP